MVEMMSKYCEDVKMFSQLCQNIVKMLSKYCHNFVKILSKYQILSK